MLTTSHPKEWYWYASRTANAVRVDQKSYPSMLVAGDRLARPDWICTSSSAGIHIDARFGRIDVHVSEPPADRIEINWTKPFALKIIKKTWLGLIDDLFDPNRVFVGDVLLKEKPLAEWQTVHGICEPALRSKKETVAVCAVCGAVNSWPLGKAFFDAPDIDDQSVLVNGSGVFVRKDIVLERNLRRPHGSHKPELVGWKPTTDELSVKKCDI